MSKTPRRILGIGTVKLKLEKWSGATGKDATTTLELHDVAHAPSALTNMIRLHLLDPGPVLELENSEGSKGRISNRNGKPLGYFAADGRLFQLKLSGPPVGPRSMQEGVNYMANSRWPDSKMKRWEVSKGGLPIKTSTRRVAVSNDR